MVKAGKPVDDVIDELVPLLERGRHHHRRRQFAVLGQRPALSRAQGEGPALHRHGRVGRRGGRAARAQHDAGRRARGLRAHRPDGDQDGRPGGRRTLLPPIIGIGGAGHYVKMVHNGIEYADMQLITEAYDLFKTVYGLDAAAIADIFEQLEVERPRQLPHRHHHRGAEEARRQDGRRARRQHRRRGRAEGHRPLDGRQRPRTRRAADRHHGSGLRPRPVEPAGRCAARPKSCCRSGPRRTRRPPRPTSTPSATRSTPPRSSPTRRASSR